MYERIQLNGRYFRVTSSTIGKAVFNLAEVIEGVKEAVGLVGDVTSWRHVTGCFQVRDNYFDFTEDTSEEEMEQLERAGRLMKLVDSVDMGVPGETTFSKSTQAVYEAVIAGSIQPEAGATIINDEITEQKRLRRADTQAGYFGLAVRWAAREELTPEERCHGVAHDAYLQSLDGAATIVDRVEYASLYGFHMSKKIKDRQIRSAKDLFGANSES